MYVTIFIHNISGKMVHMCTESNSKEDIKAAKEIAYSLLDAKESSTKKFVVALGTHLLYLVK